MMESNKVNGSGVGTIAGDIRHITWNDVIGAIQDGTLQTLEIEGCRYIVNPDSPLIADMQYVCETIKNARQSKSELKPKVETVFDKATTIVEDVEYVSDAKILGYLNSARVILESAEKEFYRTHYKMEELRLAQGLENTINLIKQMIMDFAMQCEKKIQESSKENQK